MSSISASEHGFDELERLHQDRSDWSQLPAVPREDVATANWKAPMMTFKRPPPLPKVENPLFASQCFTHRSWYELSCDRVQNQSVYNPNPEGHDGFSSLAWLGQGVMEFHASAALLELHPTAGKKFLLDLKTKLLSPTTLSHLYIRYDLHDRLKTRQNASQKLCGQAFLAYLGALHKSDHEPGSISRWTTQLCETMEWQSIAKREQKEKVKRKKAERALLKAMKPRPERASARFQKQRKRNLRIGSSDDDEQPGPAAHVNREAEVGEDMEVDEEAMVNDEVKAEEGVSWKKQKKEARVQKAKHRAQVKGAGVVKQEDDEESLPAEYPMFLRT